MEIKHHVKMGEAIVITDGAVASSDFCDCCFVAIHNKTSGKTCIMHCRPTDMGEKFDMNGLSDQQEQAVEDFMAKDGDKMACLIYGDVPEHPSFEPDYPVKISELLEQKGAQCDVKKIITEDEKAVDGYIMFDVAFDPEEKRIMVSDSTMNPIGMPPVMTGDLINFFPFNNVAIAPKDVGEVLRG